MAYSEAIYGSYLRKNREINYGTTIKVTETKTWGTRQIREIVQVDEISRLY